MKNTIRTTLSLLVILTLVPRIWAKELNQVNLQNSPPPLQVEYRPVEIKNSAAESEPSAVAGFKENSSAAIPQEPDELKRFKEPITLLETQALSLEDALKRLAMLVNVDLTIKEEVNRQAQVALNFRAVNADKVLRDILGRFGYSYHLTKNALTVFKFDFRRFELVRGPLNYSHKVSVNSERADKAGAKTDGKIGSSTSVETELSMDFWKELDTDLGKMISKEGWFTSNRSEGVVSVKDYPSVVDKIAEYITQLNCAASRQVVIQAKIMEVDISKQKAYGLDWDAIYQDMSGGIRNVSGGISVIPGVVSESAISLTGSQPIVGSGLSSKGVQGILKAIAVQGKVNVISAPKIMLTNNVPAKIQVVKKIPYISQVKADVYNGNSGLVSYEVETDEVLKGVILELSARIISRDEIFVNLTPVIKDLAGSTIPEKTFQNLTIQLPQTTDRAITTTVKVKSGETIIIGGLIQEGERETSKKVPLLGSLPLLGGLFSSKAKEKEKTEVIIMLSPQITD